MPSRVFIVNPPRNVLARVLWLLAIGVGVVLLMLFGVLIIGLGLLALASFWVVRLFARRRVTEDVSASPRAASGDVIEGEFVVVREPPRRLR